VLDDFLKLLTGGPGRAIRRLRGVPWKMSFTMKAIISQMTRGGETGLAGPTGPVRYVDPRVQKMMAYMEENFQKDLSLEKLAQSVNLSIWHFGHLFKTETGKSPVQYLKSLRLAHARKLLETTFLSIKEVMTKVGMRDQTHFAKDFKRSYGLTPKRYRAAVLSARRDGMESREGVDESWSNKQLSLLDVDQE
jgi:transcriptional regulator GlxA family with amidase domain